MSRRALASLLAAVGLFFASIAWWGHTLERNLFDPSRSEELVATLLGSEAVEDAIVAATVRSIDASLPEAARGAVPIDTLDAAIRSTLAQPEAKAAVQSALVDSHRYVIGDSETAPTLDTAILDRNLREVIAREAPAIAPIVATVPTLQITLPDAGLPVVRGIRDGVRKVTTLATLSAFGLLIAAVVVGKPRSRILRRIGWWAIISGGLWIALRYGMPALAEATFPQSAAVLRELAIVLSSRMLVPGIALSVCGALLLVAAAAIDFAERRRLARKAEKRRRLAQMATTGNDGQMASRALHRPPPTAHNPGGPTRSQPISTRARELQVPMALHQSRLPTSAPSVHRPEEPSTRSNPLSNAPARQSNPNSPFELASTAGVAQDDGTQLQASRPRIRPDGMPEADDGSVSHPDVGPRLLDPAEMQLRPATLNSIYSANPLSDASTQVPRHLEQRSQQRPGPGTGPLQRGVVSRPDWAMAPDEQPALTSPPPPPPRWSEEYGYVYEQAPTSDAVWIPDVGYVLNRD